LAINSFGITNLRLRSHSLSIKIERETIEQNRIGYIKGPPFTTSAINVFLLIGVYLK
jgi:hypothetical protein